MRDVLWATAVCATAAGWFNHIVLCIISQDPIFLTVGVLIFPIGAIHGWGNFLGVW